MFFGGRDVARSNSTVAPVTASVKGNFLLPCFLSSCVHKYVPVCRLSGNVSRPLRPFQLPLPSCQGSPVFVKRITVTQRRIKIYVVCYRKIYRICTRSYSSGSLTVYLYNRHRLL